MRPASLAVVQVACAAWIALSATLAVAFAALSFVALALAAFHISGHGFGFVGAELVWFSPVCLWFASFFSRGLNGRNEI